MADFTAITASMQAIISVAYGGICAPAMYIRPTDAAISTFYVQRIFDNSLNSFVYYRLQNITLAPTSTQTTPNHTGVSNLLTSSHEILAQLLETS